MTKDELQEAIELARLFVQLNWESDYNSKKMRLAQALLSLQAELDDTMAAASIHAGEHRKARAQLAEAEKVLRKIATTDCENKTEFKRWCCQFSQWAGDYLAKWKGKDE